MLGGITYNPIAFTANSANVYFTSIANVFGTPLFNAAGPIWAGITFDNNVGGTGATAAQLDNLGQLVMNPPTVGTSADQVFLTTAAGSNFVSSPAGATFNYGGNPRANPTVATRAPTLVGNSTSFRSRARCSPWPPASARSSLDAARRRNPRTPNPRQSRVGRRPPDVGPFDFLALLRGQGPD